MSRGLTRSNRQNTAAFGRITNHDLLGFDQAARDLILNAIAQGCTGRVSAKGHCILRNNTAETASVPRNMTAPNRASRNAKAQIRRLLATHRLDEDPEQDTLAEPSETPRPISIAQAFNDYAGAFSSWLDEQADGLPGDAAIEVRFDQSGAPTFRLIPHPASVASDERLACEEKPKMPMTTSPKTSRRPHEKEDDHPSLVPQRVREARSTTTTIAELQAENQSLRAELERQRNRADEAEVRIALVKEALGV